MERFAHVLQKAERSLRAPEPQRSRVLLELAHDLDDLFSELRAGGLTEEEAARRAEQLLSPSAESLADLAFLHAPVYVRLAERYAPGSGRTAERVLFVCLTLLSLAVAGVTLAGTGAFEGASPAMWVLSAALALLIFHGTSLLLQLPPDGGYAGGSGGPAFPAWLGAVAIVTGLTGAAGELWHLSEAAASGALRTSQVFAYVGRAADVLTFALSVLLAALLIWLLAYRRASCAGSFRAHLQKQEIAS